MTDRNLGFIGIGLMGKPMTLRLLDAGYRVTVWNRSADKLAPLVSAGAIAAASVVAASDVILLSLSDTSAVETVVFGPDGIAATANSEQLIVDLSSIAPDATQRFAAKLLADSGADWVDAPVSGGVVGAEQGTLAIIAGGSQYDVARAAKVLAPLSQRVTHMGEIGSGQVTKICNQMIVSCNVMVIAEMVALAKRSGVAAEKIPEALRGGFADSKPHPVFR